MRDKSTVMTEKSTVMTEKSTVMIKNIVLLWLLIYNIAFIPLQGAFRIKFTSSLIILEILSLIFYFVEIIILLIKYIKINQAIKRIDNKSELSNGIAWKPIEIKKK